MAQVGNRAYNQIERKQKQRQWEDRNSGRISKKRLTSAKDKMMADRLKRGV